MSIINIGLHGASGKMGKALAKAINESNKFSLAAEFSKNQNTLTLLEFCLLSDVIVDFSCADALANLLAAASNRKKKVVVGTTGLSNDNIKDLVNFSKLIPILYSPNMSLGANLVIKFSGEISRILSDYDVEVVDIHHKSKKDAPSGTAIAIGKNIAKSRKQKFEEVCVFDRFSKGIRKSGDISFSILRMGEIPGEHKVIFAGSQEVVTLSVKALSRDVFVNGALVAIEWLNSIAKPGLYSMHKIFDV